jgi:hypothetical protein
MSQSRPNYQKIHNYDRVSTRDISTYKQTELARHLNKQLVLQQTVEGRGGIGSERTCDGVSKKGQWHDSELEEGKVQGMCAATPRSLLRPAATATVVGAPGWVRWARAAGFGFTAAGSKPSVARFVTRPATGVPPCRGSPHTAAPPGWVRCGGGRGGARGLPPPPPERGSEKEGVAGPSEVEQCAACGRRSN